MSNWVLDLSMYDLNRVWIRGEANILADAPSRNPVENDIVRNLPLPDITIREFIRKMYMDPEDLQRLCQGKATKMQLSVGVPPSIPPPSVVEDAKNEEFMDHLERRSARVPRANRGKASEADEETTTHAGDARSSKDAEEEESSEEEEEASQNDSEWFSSSHSTSSTRSSFVSREVRCLDVNGLFNVAYIEHGRRKKARRRTRLKASKPSISYFGLAEEDLGPGYVDYEYLGHDDARHFADRCAVLDCCEGLHSYIPRPCLGAAPVPDDNFAYPEEEEGSAGAFGGVWPKFPVWVPMVESGDYDSILPLSIAGPALPREGDMPMTLSLVKDSHDNTKGYYQLKWNAPCYFRDGDLASTKAFSFGTAAGSRRRMHETKEEAWAAVKSYFRQCSVASVILPIGQPGTFGKGAVRVLSGDEVKDNEWYYHGEEDTHRFAVYDFEKMGSVKFPEWDHMCYTCEKAKDFCSHNSHFKVVRIPTETSVTITVTYTCLGHHVKMPAGEDSRETGFDEQPDRAAQERRVLAPPMSATSSSSKAKPAEVDPLPEPPLDRGIKDVYDAAEEEKKWEAIQAKCQKLEKDPLPKPFTGIAGYNREVLKALVVRDPLLGPIYYVHAMLHKHRAVDSARQSLLNYMAKQRKANPPFGAKEAAKRDHMIPSEVNKIMYRAMDEFEVYDEYLYRRVYSKQSGEWELRLAVPKGGSQKVVVPMVGTVPLTLREAIIHHYHELPMSNHFSRDALFETVSRDFWWPDLYSDCEKHWASCLHCRAKSKAHTHSVSPWARSTLYDSPFRVIQVDIEGSLGVKGQVSVNRYLLSVICCF